MGKFYHIDRLESLSVGKEITLQKIKDIDGGNPEYSKLLQRHFDTFMEAGVTRHGDSYFAGGNADHTTSYDIELIFEYERRLNFHERPSRFQSVFAVDKEYLIPMIQRLGISPETACIYEVECDNYFRADMNLLLKRSNLVNTFFANRYWKGESLGIPLYEYLLVPPVKVIRKVNIEEIN